MNNCPNPAYDLQCPFALSERSPLPCYGSQEQCDEYRKKREKEKEDE